ncbi:MAG TPA: metallophosphoesterase [Acidobacteriaceae bacterium]|nr:metallophosphoesterase [Acidobacteriaceae bacterium]
MNPLSTVEASKKEKRRGTGSGPGRRVSRRSFLKLSAAAAGGLALYSGEIARHELSVEEHTIRLERLPDAFRGMRIAQISDLHYEGFTEGFFLREVVRRVNRLQPDMVLLTGDFITKFPTLDRVPRQQMPRCAAILSALRCPLRFASLGNHDEAIGKDYVIAPLEEHGIPVLVNRATPLERDGQRLWLAGVGSACEQDADPASAIPRACVNGNEAVILMAHEPDPLPDYARYNVDLVLSGHTHGGQVRLPLLPAFALPEYGRNYVEGLFHHGRTQLYVNRGIGTVGLPFRLWCPPEITVFTLA